MKDEIFSIGPVMITPTIAQFGSASYPIRNIGAVELKAVNEGGTVGCGVVVMIFGALAAIGALMDGAIGVVLGMICAVVAGYGLTQNLPTIHHIVELRTSSGNQQVYRSTNYADVQKIKQALETAISYRE